MLDEDDDDDDDDDGYDVDPGEEGAIVGRGGATSISIGPVEGVGVPVDAGVDVAATAFPTAQRRAVVAIPDDDDEEDGARWTAIAHRSGRTTAAAAAAAAARIE